jgi:hypothetical protein
LWSSELEVPSGGPASTNSARVTMGPAFSIPQRAAPRLVTSLAEKPFHI